jgi:signal peptidase I
MTGHPPDDAPLPQPRPKGIIRDYFETIVTCVIFVIFARTFVFQNSKIPTGSMVPTLLVGDYIMVNKHVYAPTLFSWEKRLLPIREIRRGDIVVFKYPEEPEKDYIKRIVGLAGDVVEVRNREFYLNGVRQKEPYVQHIYRSGLNLDADDYPPTKVPPGHYFAMGDNRDNSRDSRAWGFVPREFVKGRAFVVFWSYEEERDAYLKTGVSDRLAGIWSKITHLFTRSRWERSFKLIR